MAGDHGMSKRELWPSAMSPPEVGSSLIHRSSPNRKEVSWEDGSYVVLCCRYHTHWLLTCNQCRWILKLTTWAWVWKQGVIRHVRITGNSIFNNPIPASIAWNMYSVLCTPYTTAVFVAGRSHANILMIGCRQVHRVECQIRACCHVKWRKTKNKGCILNAWHLHCQARSPSNKSTFPSSTSVRSDLLIADRRVTWKLPLE